MFTIERIRLKYRAACYRYPNFLFTVLLLVQGRHSNGCLLKIILNIVRVPAQRRRHGGDKIL